MRRSASGTISSRAANWPPRVLGLRKPPIPGVLNQCPEKLSDGLLEYPQYTRPREIDGMEVPEVLLSGDHAKIRAWRREESLRATLRFRPDLLENACLTEKERHFLDNMRKEMKGSCSPEN